MVGNMVIVDCIIRLHPVSVFVSTLSNVSFGCTVDILPGVMCSATMVPWMLFLFFVLILLTLPFPLPFCLLAPSVHPLSALCSDLEQFICWCSHLCVASEAAGSVLWLELCSHLRFQSDLKASFGSNSAVNVMFIHLNSLLAEFCSVMQSQYTERDRLTIFADGFGFQRVN